MGVTTFAGFRTFLEKFEAKTQKDKESARDRASTDKPMDSLGGMEFHFLRGPRDKKAAMLAKILRTTPEIMSGAKVDDLDANYVPVSIDPGLRGGSMEVIPVGAEMQASRKGRDVGPDKIGYSKRHLKRKDIVGIYDRPWGSAVAAAAGGGAAGGAAPPPM